MMTHAIRSTLLVMIFEGKRVELSICHDPKFKYFVSRTLQLHHLSHNEMNHIRYKPIVLVALEVVSNTHSTIGLLPFHPFIQNPN